MRSAAFALAVAAVLPLSRTVAAEDLRPGGVLTIRGEKAAIARQSKSPDGRYALAWTPKEKEDVDWSLLESDVGAFYDRHDAAEVWVVDLLQPGKLDTLVSSRSYIRPGTHRSLAAAWGPGDDNSRRFALGAYDWKWGTDTLYLIDVGPEGSRHTVISPQLDEAVARFLQRTSADAKTALNVNYLVSGLPEHGTRTGFSDPTTVRLPFVASAPPGDRPIAEGIITLKLGRAGSSPIATVAKITRGTVSGSFRDDARLARADAELNAVYGRLLKRLGSAKRDQLRKEQRAWLKQRDQLVSGTPADAAANARITRDRALTELTTKRVAELRKRLESLDP